MLLSALLPLLPPLADELEPRCVVVDEDEPCERFGVVLLTEPDLLDEPAAEVDAGCFCSDAEGGRTEVGSALRAASLCVLRDGGCCWFLLAGTLSDAALADGTGVFPLSRLLPLLGAVFPFRGDSSSLASCMRSLSYSKSDTGSSLVPVSLAESDSE